ncbi:hypothetical protein CIPAW_07G021100 [Carya illinoinensis]|uniref:Uncharacterized protein n=1 Tax=Carya illinoinensis TaxID=32201 RepID=A0A8T1PYX4_CARIL|nr:hypothetical protein CIPAW_07G021100 [Carya illinoinensis]
MAANPNANSVLLDLQGWRSFTFILTQSRDGTREVSTKV